jgi:periplasmic protein TonB
MRWSVVGYTLSIGAHLAAAGGILRIPKSVENQVRPVTIFSAKAPQKAHAEVKPEEQEPKPKPKLAPPPPPPKTENVAPQAPKAAPMPAAEPAHQALAALPDLGISLGGLAVGGPGIAVPVAAAGAAALAPGAAAAAGVAPKEVKAKVLSAKPKSESHDDACEEEPTKPKQLGIVRPQYTDDARSAGVEGKVRVEITIGPDGEVTSAHVVSGIGHGLDEAALTAAKRMKFSPSMRCGKTVESKFTISIRFSLVE